MCRFWLPLKCNPSIRSAARMSRALLPDNEALVARAETMMAVDPKAYFSNNAHRTRRLRALEELDLPPWALSIFRWTLQRTIR